MLASSGSAPVERGQDLGHARADRARREQHVRPLWPRPIAQRAVVLRADGQHAAQLRGGAFGARSVALGDDDEISHLEQAGLDGLHLVAHLRRLDDVLVTAGGIIPDDDVPALEAAGVSRIFGPGTTIREVAEYIRGNVRSRER